jgi:hypothetical protein
VKLADTHRQQNFAVNFFDIVIVLNIQSNAHPILWVRENTRKPFYVTEISNTSPKTEGTCTHSSGLSSSYIPSGFNTSLTASKAAVPKTAWPDGKAGKAGEAPGNLRLVLGPPSGTQSLSCIHY